MWVILILVLIDYVQLSQKCHADILLIQIVFIMSACIKSTVFLGHFQSTQQNTRRWTNVG